MEKRRVVITGLGTVNPLGNTAADTYLQHAAAAFEGNKRSWSRAFP